MKNSLYIIGLLCLGIVTSNEICRAQNPLLPELLKPYILNNELPGFVTVIADKDNVLQLNLFGYADVEAKQAMTPDTLFWLASQTKAVTAVGVMILVEEGKLALDEPVTKYLPELKELWVVSEKDETHQLLVSAKTSPTLRQLLSHTGGIVYKSPLQSRFGIDALPLNRLVVECAATPLLAQPGEQCNYSNFGTDIAAAVIERVSGQPFEVFLQQRLFEPLGMVDTTFFPTEQQLKRCAKMYKLKSDADKTLIETRIGLLTYPLHDRTVRHPSAGGGLFSTPNDFVRFFQMLLNDGKFKGKQILSENSVCEIRTKQTPDHIQKTFGLGVGTSTREWTASGAGGTEAHVYLDRKKTILFFVEELALPKAAEVRNVFRKNAFQEGK